MNPGRGNAGGSKEAAVRGATAEVIHSALYGAINGTVAVPAMVSFVAITFQVRTSISACCTGQHTAVMYEYKQVC